MDRSENESKKITIKLSMEEETDQMVDSCILNRDRQKYKTIKDYMKIEYSKGSCLYILATQLDAIQKYSSADGEKVPKLNSLGGQDWKKTKTRVRSAVQLVAKDLVELYAARQSEKGYVYGPEGI